MELIKKIKEAEARGQQMIEQAKKDAAMESEKLKEKCRQLTEQAQRERKRAIESAIAGAEAEAEAEIKKLREQGAGQLRQLRAKAGARMQAAVDTVVDFLKG